MTIVTPMTKVMEQKFKSIISYSNCLKVVVKFHISSVTRILKINLFLDNIQNFGLIFMIKNDTLKYGFNTDFDKSTAKGYFLSN